MASSATALAGKNETFNFVNVFNNPTTANIAVSGHYDGDASRTFIEWLKSSDIVIHVPTAALVPIDESIVTFTLRDAYKNSFILLRGLLEFSRPKGIQISSNFTDRTFQVRIPAGQAGTVTQHLHTISGWLLREIRFKTSLKAIMGFENRVRQIQANLYRELSIAL